MAYLLDADVFIRAKNLHYGLDFCPAFWDWLIAQKLYRITARSPTRPGRGLRWPELSPAGGACRL